MPDSLRESSQLRRYKSQRLQYTAADVFADSDGAQKLQKLISPSFVAETLTLTVSRWDLIAKLAQPCKMTSITNKTPYK